MTPRQKELVQISFEQIKPEADTAARMFYYQLFELDPKLAQLFTGNLVEQARKFMSMVGLAVKGLNRSDELVPLLQDLGTRHASYGVKEENYRTVATALLWTVERLQGKAFTAEVRDAWKAAYEFFAGTMQAAARESLVVVASGQPSQSPTVRSGWRSYFPAAVNRTATTRSGGREAVRKHSASPLVTRAKRVVLVLGLLLLATTATRAGVITVTSAADTIAVDGVVTLREAITAANTNQPSGDAPKGDPGMDTIKFNIPGGGVQTIALITVLPTITEPITIDGYTQPGASPNTLPVGNNAVLLIELNGAAAGANTKGLLINAGGSTIRGLIINRFSNSAIFLTLNGNNLIAGNFLGTNATGDAAFPTPNNTQGVYIASASNVIGGINPADRNVISGNGTSSGGSGVYIDATSGNKVIGNYIGTDATGMKRTPNPTNGIVLDSATSNFIGGTTASERNVISGGNNIGVSFRGTSSANHVTGNYIGICADGTQGQSMGNGRGVDFSGTASNNFVGGTQPGAGNTIAFSQMMGVVVFEVNVGNSILGNSIFKNGGSTTYLGIELFNGGYGVNPNDNNTGDADTGANKLQNYPVITSALSIGGTTTIKGTLNSAANSSFRIELFSNDVCDASGFGEGRNYLGSVNLTTDATGIGAFDFTVPTAAVVGGLFTATATDPDGNTSEFSACASGTVANPGTLQLSTTTVSGSEGAGMLGVSVTRTNGSTGTVTVQYATAEGSAKAPGDYTATSGTLVFNDGETAKSITVPIIDDNTPEGSEYFSLTISNPTGGGILGAAKSAQFIIHDNELPSFAINDPSASEGNQGTSKIVFTVTLSNPVTSSTSVDYKTISGGTATAGIDYQAVNGTLTFNPGETVKQLEVPITSDTISEPDETVIVNLSVAQQAAIAKAQGVGTIVNDDQAAPPAQPAFQFAQSSYSVQEDLGSVTITVTRGGDTSAAAAVDYATVDGTATQKSDFEFAAGTLSFAPGEASKTVVLLLNEDAHPEGNEAFNVSLSNPVGAVLGQQSTSVTISDDLPEAFTNPIDDAQTFVHMHYHDLLNRAPDADGLAFWTNQIAACGTDAKCIEEQRINVSAAFFLSIEFQETGYLRYLLQKESFNSTPKYAEYMRDLQEISRGVIVGSAGWEQKLKDNQQQFVEKWVNRPEFKAAYDGMSNTDFVNVLYANAGILPTQADRQLLVNALDGGNQSRSAVVLELAGNAQFRQKEHSAAFVMMQYFAYLRRDPNAAPDIDLSGYNFWLTKLNQFGGNYIDAEMIKAFITSFEYRQRFAQ